MATTSTTKETRLLFDLQLGNDTVTRTITLPGQATNGADFETAYNEFRAAVLDSESGFTQFVQPATWRDNTGSDDDEPNPPWTTIDVRAELYTVTKVLYTAAS